MLDQNITVQKAIGSGGFGTVYLAEAQDSYGLRKQIAIKQLNPSLASSEEALARQITEARLLGLLNHEHIVQVYDIGLLDDQLSIFLEYVEGVSLSALLQSHALPFRSIIEIIAACADALDAAFTTPHLQTKEPLKVIHRDIKPSNILLSKTGCTKLLDFGIAKGNFERELDTSDHQIGTRRYMAPEQWLYNQVSEKVDIYALGMTFLELLHQRLLPRFPLERQHFSAQQHKQIDALTLPESSAIPLRKLLYGMLAYEPTDRPSAQIVKQICLQLLEQAPGQTLRLFAQETIPSVLRAQLSSLSDTPLPSASVSFTSFYTVPIPPIPPTREYPVSPTIPQPKNARQTHQLLIGITIVLIGLLYFFFLFFL